MLDLDEYLLDPCGTSSIPYWKTLSVSVPSNMKILHHGDFTAEAFRDYTDEPYFRLLHDLRQLPAAVLPAGHSVCTATLGEFATHICDCYGSDCMTEALLSDFTKRDVYDAALWLAVRDDQTGRIVASGIAELDKRIGEGVLEWIQVSADHRRKGLGRFLVAELLHRMKASARFATVSGQCNNPTCPEELYRSCGFAGNDVWHILRKKG